MSYGEKSLGSHFSIFIYPFFHPIKDDLIENVSPRIYEKWDSWICRLKDKDQIINALDSTYFYLPFIKNILFPEFRDLNHKNPSIDKILKKKKTLQESNVLNKHKVSNNIYKNSKIVHLTLNEDILNSISKFEIYDSKKTDSLRANFEWIDLVLFSQGIGFILLKTKLDKSNNNISNLFELNDKFSIIEKPFLDFVLPNLRIKSKTELINTKLLLKFLLEEVLKEKSMEYLNNETASIYGEHFYLYSYGSISIDETDTEADPDYLKNRLYEYATNAKFGSSVTKECTSVPSDNWKEEVLKNRISLWSNWSGVALKKQIVFLANTNDVFTQNYLPNNLEYDYLSMYVLALYQKIRLYNYNENIIRNELKVRDRYKAILKLHESFVEFKNYFWFYEITKKPQGIYLFDKISKALDTKPSFELVSSEIKELSSYYETKISNKIKNLLNIITFVLTPIAMINGIFHAKIYSLNWVDIHPNWLLLVYVSSFVLLIYLCIHLYYKKRNKYA